MKTVAPMLLCIVSAGALAMPINQSQSCPGGGSRSLVGDYNVLSGQLDLTITLTNCVGLGSSILENRGRDATGTALATGRHSGTVVLSGTVVPGSLWRVDLKERANTLSVWPAGDQVARVCTITRTGTFDQATGHLQGKITRDQCSLEGSLGDDLGLN